MPIVLNSLGTMSLDQLGVYSFAMYIIYIRPLIVYVKNYFAQDRNRQTMISQSLRADPKGR